MYDVRCVPLGEFVDILVLDDNVLQSFRVVNINRFALKTDVLMSLFDHTDTKILTPNMLCSLTTDSYFSLISSRKFHPCLSNSWPRLPFRESVPHHRMRSLHDGTFPP